MVQVAEINGLETPKNTDRGQFELLTKFPLERKETIRLDSIVTPAMSTDRPQTQDSQMSIESNRSTLQG